VHGQRASIVRVVSVFTDGPGGGNPAPTVVDAAGLSDAEMQQIARHYGHESGFVLPAPEGSGCDLALRFWVPNHEMEMCGHATVGAIWLLAELGVLDREEVIVWTRSGPVTARIGRDAAGGRAVEISQPSGTVAPVASDVAADILAALGISSTDLANTPIRNACTSRVKTLVPLADADRLDALRPDFDRVDEVCARAGSTGLYPYAWRDRDALVLDARQFPRASGYPEDAATGIAAAALAFGLLADGEVTPGGGPLRVRQGRAMGRPSAISVRFRHDGDQVVGCWLGGEVHLP
jgi:PhzF family phenazine biosynthesis protein